MRRRCVGLFLSSLDQEDIPSSRHYTGQLEVNICPELSLAEQNFQCAECSAELTGFGESRLCDYTGQYFCSLCHWGSSNLPSPARIIHNWDGTASSVPEFRRPSQDDSDEEEKFTAGMKRMVTRAELHKKHFK